jgi:hypothetical protein
MIAADAPAEARLSFIRKTYMHLAAAVYALVMLEFLFFYTLPLDTLVPQVFGNMMGMLLMFGGFMIAGTVARRWAESNASVGKQYAGLFLYVLAEAIFLCPLLWIANSRSLQVWQGAEVSPILAAAAITLAVFGVLTATVFLTKHDFSYLGPILGIASVAVFGLIALSFLGMFNFGIVACSGVALLACGYILYDTSNVLHHYRTEQHVAASLALFASVALLFWYILRIVISLSGRD